MRERRRHWTLLLRGLPDGWIEAHEGADTWSPFDIIGHLVQGERSDWMPRARVILEHGEARAFDPFDRFAQFTVGRDARSPAFSTSSRRCARETLRELATLGLSDMDFDRRGQHPDSVS